MDRRRDSPHGYFQRSAACAFRDRPGRAGRRGCIRRSNSGNPRRCTRRADFRHRTAGGIARVSRAPAPTARPGEAQRAWRIPTSPSGGSWAKGSASAVTRPLGSEVWQRRRGRRVGAWRSEPAWSAPANRLPAAVRPSRRRPPPVTARHRRGGCGR